MGRAIPTSCHVGGILRIASPNHIPQGITAKQWLCTDTEAPAPCVLFPLIFYSVISWTPLETRKCNWYSSMGPREIQLTHWSRDKMTAIFQTTFFKCISWMKMYGFRLNFHWRSFQGSNQQYSSTGLDNGLAPTRRQAIIWTNGG